LTVTVFTGTIDAVNVEAADETASTEFTIDDLARRVGLPVRTIREYQTTGLLPPPARRGRVGMYGRNHEYRLALVQRLQARGYSLAGIRDLLESWRDGGDLGEVLGLVADQLVHVEEPGAPATVEQLSRAIPELVPDRLAELIGTGVVEACGPDRYCVPSPSLLQLARDSIRVGFAPDAVLQLLNDIGRATSAMADSVVTAMAERPPNTDSEQLLAFGTRARGLLGHGTGRLTIHAIGKQLGITDDDAVIDGLRRVWEVEDS
jgi:DNA-binding transcriptional MerR regulator